MFRTPVPVREYEQLAKQFNPVKFDANAWVQLAKDAGMKYIVITSKHHDGFALYQSKVSSYDVVDATPFKRDILKELADACAKQGMRLGFYYSQSQDWHDPNGIGNTWDFGPDEKKDFDKYLREKAEPQVRELLTGYGPVALIWFDTPRFMTPERGAALRRHRALDPAEDADRRPARDPRATTSRPATTSSRPTCRRTAWEVPATINHTWGYKSYDHDWKSAGQHHLQARGHRQQGRQLPAERGPDGRRHHPAAEPGRAARRRARG